MLLYIWAINCVPMMVLSFWPGLGSICIVRMRDKGVGRMIILWNKSQNEIQIHTHGVCNVHTILEKNNGHPRSQPLQNTCTVHTQTHTFS